MFPKPLLRAVGTVNPFRMETPSTLDASPPEISPQAWLQTEFQIRRKKNPSYSLRRMAQQLELPSGRLSEILSGRRRLTKPIALRISERFSYTPERRQQFLAVVEAARKGATSVVYTEADYLQLSTDAFHVLADWHHFAILSLMELHDFDRKPTAIAARLGISSVEARSSLDRMTRLGLIREDGEKMVKTSGNITTTHDIESAALKLSHKQNLDLASAALDDVELALRDVTSVTMAIDVAKLPLAKEMIKKFRRQLSAFLESDLKNEVYNLNVQLFPLTKKRSKK